MAVSRNGQQVAFFSSDVLRLVDLTTGKVRRHWLGPRGFQHVSAVTWSPDDRYIGVGLLGAGSGAFAMIGVEDETGPMAVHDARATGLDWHPTGRLIAHTTPDRPGGNELRVVELRSDWATRYRQMEVPRPEMGER